MTLRGSLTVAFCVFKHIGYHMSYVMKSGIFLQLDSSARMKRWHAVLLKSNCT